MLESLFNEVAVRKETPTQVLSYAYCKFFNNIYFQKHLQTTASDYSFTIVIYLFLVVSLQLTMTFYNEECSLKLDYVIQDVCFKGHVKIIKIYMVKFNVSV